MAKRRRWRTAAADVLADVGDLVGEELAKSFNVNGRACWYSTKTHQDVDGLPVSSGPTGQLHSCRAKILCLFGATVDSKDVIYPTCVLLQYASQRRIQNFPRARGPRRAPKRRSEADPPAGSRGRTSGMG